METTKLTCCDIMVGDYAKLSKGNWSEIRQLELIDIEMIAEGVYFAEPIPLTAEILGKNFERGEYDGYSYYEINDEFCIRNAYDRIFLAQWTDSESSLSQYPKFIIDIESVEKLQHTLRLCGVDKEIVL